MTGTFIPRVLPLFAEPRQGAEFNVFDVLHHGTNEKQLSNLFAWLLDSKGTHRLGDAFLRIFIDAVNRGRPTGVPVPYGDYAVAQERNVALEGEPGDFADLVLEKSDFGIVVENYFVSDGHGHGFDDYLRFATRDATRAGVVVMLCGSVESARLVSGWQDAAVVTHADLVRELNKHVDSQNSYAEDHPAQFAFIQQINRHFVRGRIVDDDRTIKFLEAMCASGEAEYYGRQNRENAALDFASRLSEQARDEFGQGLELLRRAKTELMNFSNEVLKASLNDALGSAVIGQVFGRYRGSSEWTIGFYKEAEPEEWLVQIKFGPSAWAANEQAGPRIDAVPAADADYSCLFLTFEDRVTQSSVTLHHVLGGLAPDDTRLLDDLVALIRRP